MFFQLLLPTLLMQAANASSMSNRKDSSALQLEVAGQDLQLPQPRKQGQFRDKVRGRESREALYFLLASIRVHLIIYKHAGCVDRDRGAWNNGC